ncbi:MAG: ATP-grasp domain-containing protein [Acidobacteria bacterium]|nr:MAG: ATP-grasp domain-containing protein [Acidobacteriota bacterium]REK00392.1 MAG: ATP-grasp domain-containing protein [Acidobacteriota bacterium]
MFRKLLIANRGEVAVRVARTAHRLGIECVGVASEADRDASWTRQLDRVVVLGPPASAESYLAMERIVQAGRQSGCSAVHPGWGFLAESPDFAALCEQWGLTFVGPRPATMDRLGKKLPAKRAMARAGLEPIPGSLEPLESDEQAQRLAREIGFPVIVKADSGGGGRGMRRCDEPQQLSAAIDEAAAEARAAFGDPTVYLEKYLAGGRHIEVQVLADAFGAAVHLGERDCSVQRKHQKLIEETPSPGLDDRQRAELGRAAAEAAARIGYRGAGTVEFLQAPGGEIYFMEMNTRLQVEHPVSEEVTGIDLVEHQLRVAANQPLALRQEEIGFLGCAIECRINAEDPNDDFRPSPGEVTRFDFPAAVDDTAGARVRVDSHVTAGDEVPPFYDSLLAKVIVHAPSRAAAIDAMVEVLGAAHIEGVKTTIPLHLEVLDSSAFRSGDYSTAAIPGWPPADRSGGDA